MSSSVTTDIHLAKNDRETACERVYSHLAYAHGKPTIKVYTGKDFGGHVEAQSASPCEVCWRKYQTGQMKVFRAMAAIERRVAIGSTTEEALRNTRQEYDLSSDEENDLIRELARKMAT